VKSSSLTTRAENRSRPRPLRAVSPTPRFPATNNWTPAASTNHPHQSAAATPRQDRPVIPPVTDKSSHLKKVSESVAWRNRESAAPSRHRVPVPSSKPSSDAPLTPDGAETSLRPRHSFPVIAPRRLKPKPTQHSVKISHRYPSIPDSLLPHRSSTSPPTEKKSPSSAT